ncbi:MAG: glycosyltransferase family 2 protein [Acidimicrobiales bacterium]
MATLARRGSAESNGAGMSPQDTCPEGKVAFLSVVVPAYKEANTIGEALHRLTQVLDDLDRPYEVIVVSDGNTDGTPDIARALKLPHVRVLHYAQNAGKGYALCYGVKRARGDLIAFIDADLDIHPSGIARFLDLLETSNADAVVASKIHPESQVAYPPFRRLQSKVFRQLVEIFFNLDVSDTQTGLKLFRRELVDACLPRITTAGFAFDLELLVLANDSSFRVIEGPLQIDYTFTSTTGWPAVLHMLSDMIRLEYRRMIGRRNGTWVTCHTIDTTTQPARKNPLQKSSPK